MGEEEKEATPTTPATGKKKPAPLKGFQHFQKARKTTEEMYNDISTGASMTINTWLNLFGASTMAAGGLTTNATVFIVAAMLVSPIMGPILGMTLGYRISDWPLFRTGFINEVKMAFATYCSGLVFGFVLGDVGNTYKWPNNAMMPEGQAFNLIISIIVSAAAGTVLGVSMTTAGGNALVGTAISAGLLPPLVNAGAIYSAALRCVIFVAGMLHSYSYAYAVPTMKAALNEMGQFAIFFYFTHVVTIVIVANFVFYLKDVDPRFREGEDSNFEDIPALVEHKKRLEAQGKKYDEKEKAEFFFNNVREELTGLAFGLKDKAADLAHMAGIRLTDKRRVPGESESDYSGSEEYDEEEGDLEEGSAHSKSSTTLAKSKALSPQKSKKGFVSMEDEEEGKGDDEEVGQATPSRRSRMSSRKKDYTAVVNNNAALEEEEASGVVVNPLLSATAAPRAQSVAEYAELIREFYFQYNPSKLDDLPAIMKRYEGKERELLLKLYNQYGIIPPSTIV